MARQPSGPADVPPQRQPLTTPEDLFPTSDIRFVLHSIGNMHAEIGKLTAKVDRLIEDVKTDATRIDEIRHSASFIKGAFWVGSAALTVAIAIVGFLLSGKADAILDAVGKLSK